MEGKTIIQLSKEDVIKAIQDYFDNIFALEHSPKVTNISEVSDYNQTTYKIEAQPKEKEKENESK